MPDPTDTPHDAEPDPSAEPDGASPAPTGPAYTVPARPGAWPDLLGRRPLSSSDRARLRARLESRPPGALDAPARSCAT